MLLEVCVDTLEGAQAAIDGGAGRIELCSSLSEGGLTPSAGFMRAAAILPVPCFAMIRPRCGLFGFTDIEADVMMSDIEAAREAGLAGVVLGAQTVEGHLDQKLLKRLVNAATGMGKTLHRVVDVVPDPVSAIEQAIDLGFERVLTSGAQPSAPDGVQLIRQLVEKFKDQISIMPGCGLTPENVGRVVTMTGVSEVHAACSVRAPGNPAFSDFDPPGGRFVTSRIEVQKMVSALLL